MSTPAGSGCSLGLGSCSSSAFAESSAGREVARAEGAARPRVERDDAVARAVDREVPLHLRRRLLGVGLVEAEELCELRLRDELGSVAEANGQTVRG